MAAHNDPDSSVADLANRSYGVVTYSQLRACGLGRQAIGYRVASRRLIELYTGVYAVGHTALRVEGRWLAAAHAGGAAAVLSHGDAAALWELAPVRGTRIHVTTPRRSGREPARPVRLHRVGTLRGDEVARHRGIPVTTVARTLLDLAPHTSERKLEDLVAQADRLERFDLIAVHRTIAAHPRQPGRRKLIALLDRLQGVGVADTRSAAEVALLEMCDAYDLPVPLVNVHLAGLTVDFHWPAAKLVVEIDGYTYHSMPSAFENDRDRDQVLALAGCRVVRFSYNQLVRHRQRSARRLVSLLTESGSL